MKWTTWVLLAFVWMVGQSIAAADDTTAGQFAAEDKFAALDESVSKSRLDQPPADASQPLTDSATWHDGLPIGAPPDAAADIYDNAGAEHSAATQAEGAQWLREILRPANEMDAPPAPPQEAAPAPAELQMAQGADRQLSDFGLEGGINRPANGQSGADRQQLFAPPRDSPIESAWEKMEARPISASDGDLAEVGQSDHESDSSTRIQPTGHQLAADGDEPSPRGWGAFALLFMGLIASVAFNCYLGWIAWDIHGRYQDVVAEVHELETELEKRRERSGRSRDQLVS